MNLDESEFNLKGKSQLSVFTLSDLHIGAKNHNFELLEYWGRIFKRTSGQKIIYGLGDYIDYASKDVGAFDNVLSADEQINYLIKFLKPLKNSIRVLCSGNHEARAKKFFNLSILKVIGEELDIPITDNHYFDKLIINDEPFIVYGRHGNKTSNKLHLAMGGWERSTEHITADLLLMGHNHYCTSWNKTIMNQDQLKQRHYCFCGHMLNYNNSYADDMGLNVSPPSFMKLNISRKHRVTGEEYTDLGQCNGEELL
ncbi:metallophosphoesterase [Methanobrevibacter sp. DSM 116169]|uniref:metallophosphoesterase n=1 Tax=Methanobrevibacter sp. DSM 116169 TaxID=3242727 RepID=UPI0038FCAD7A